MSLTASPRPQLTSRLTAALTLFATPAVVIFLSSNFVNAGNLAFNMIFSRWMGPELFGDLAVVLTIKLALLGVLGALQMAVSQMVAGADASEGERSEQALARINRYSFWILWLALPLLAAGLFLGSVDARLDLGSPFLLYIILGSLPFCAPLSILRGVALGQMNTNKIVLSANVEMAVRLIIGVIAWQAGLGIEGVVAAIGASIIAGWAVLTDVLPTPTLPKQPTRDVAKVLGISAMPFALLQISQVIALDGDIFLATRFLGDTETGYVAALSLFQRIQFFACFTLSGVLLPAVITAARTGQSYRDSVLPIVALLIVVSITVLTMTALWPEHLLSIMVGAEYIPAAAYLWIVALAAVIFTANYLTATFLVAVGDRSGIAIIVTGTLVQIVVMTWTLILPTGDLQSMLSAKLACQLIIFVLLLGRLFTMKTPQ